MSTDSSTSKIWSSEGFESDFLGRFGCFNENYVLSWDFLRPKEKTQIHFHCYRTLIEKGKREGREKWEKIRKKFLTWHLYIYAVLYESKFIFLYYFKF
jgi:hypothetical protein